MAEKCQQSIVFKQYNAWVVGLHSGASEKNPRIDSPTPTICYIDSLSDEMNVDDNAEPKAFYL